MRWHEALLVATSLAAPAAAAADPYQELFRLYPFPAQLTLDAVPVCYHHGCSSVAKVAIDQEGWMRVSRHLQPRAETAAAERTQIRLAVAEMEHLTGALAGTAHDRGGDLQGFGTLAPQMDCIDESANTTTYLTLFERAGLLRWHRVVSRANRGYLFFGGWPHYSAMIRENGNGALWVVDAWFEDNGEPPHIVGLEAWRDGWKPEGFTF